MGADGPGPGQLRFGSSPGTHVLFPRPRFPLRGIGTAGEGGRAGALARGDLGAGPEPPARELFRRISTCGPVARRCITAHLQRHHERDGAVGLGICTLGWPPCVPRGSGPLARIRGRAGSGRLGRARGARCPGGSGPGAGIPHDPGRPGAGGKSVLSRCIGSHPSLGPRSGARARRQQRHEPRPARIGPAEGRCQAAHHRRNLSQPHGRHLHQGPERADPGTHANPRDSPGGR